MLKEFKTVLPYLARYKYKYIAGLIFLLITDAAQLMIPQVIKTAVDYISGGTGNVVNQVLYLIGLAAAIAVGRFLWRFFIQGSARKIESSMRETIYNKFLSLSPAFYGKHKTGDLMALVTNDLNSVRMACGMAAVALFDGLFMAVGIIVILITQYGKLAGVVILPLPIITFIILFFGRSIGPLFRKVQEGFAALSEHTRELLTGIRVIKSYRREKWFLKQYAARNDDFLKKNMALVRIWGLMFPIVSFLAGLTSFLLLRFGGPMVISGSLSTGDYVAVLSYLEQIIWPMMGAGFTVNMLQRGAASLSRINEVLRSEESIPEKEEGVRILGKRNISIRNLEFRYPEAAEPALINISFELPEGNTLGILGRTGSGKTTLLNLFPRLLDPPESSIFIGNRDIHQYQLKSLRNSIGYVNQESFLFSDSIRNNICFASQEADQKKIEAAAELSTISRDLKYFPEGMETMIGELGVTLSGGQKQRVAISRTIITDPDILIFDDALSAVDAETESKILGSFISTRKGKTNIIVSNRIQALKHADEILILENGTISDRGTHRELLEREGLYREIAVLQQETEA